MYRRSSLNAVVDDVLQELEQESESEAFVGPSGLQYAVVANRRYKTILGWDRYEVDIGRLLGFSNSSPTETLFAQSVMDWQASDGISPADGMVGPVTWARMRDALGLAQAPSAAPPAAPAGVAQLVPLLNKYRGDVPLYFVLGWVYVESGGQIGSSTNLGELGYFQIHPGESQVLHLDHPRLHSDAEYSVYGGIQLVNHYADLAQKLGFQRGTELFWSATKWHHWAPAGVALIVKDIRANGLEPTTGSWDVIQDYVTKNQVRLGALMDLHFPVKGQHWDVMFGIRNVNKTMAAGKKLAATLGV
jgi:peptidoglycan hydrolase-like protein with peptidoglycan-binding domain